MVINTNLPAQTAASDLLLSQANLGKSLARLSSGSKIVTPADDAAGLVDAGRLAAQIKRIDAANANVGNAVSFTQTQDGYLKKIAKAFDRMGELAILAQDITKSDADRSLYNAEFQQLTSYVNNAANKDFNGVSLFSAAALNINVDSEHDVFTMNGVDLTAAVYATTLAADITTRAACRNPLTDLSARHSTHRSKPQPPNPDYYDSGIPHPHRERD
jgi:flagellin